MAKSNVPIVKENSKLDKCLHCGYEGKMNPGIVLDPFGGSGTVGVVAKKLGRSYILIDIKPEYCEMARKRIANTMGRLL